MKKSLSLIAAVMLFVRCGPNPALQEEDPLARVLQQLCSTHDRDTVLAQNIQVVQQFLGGFRQGEFDDAVDPNVVEAHDCQAFIEFDEDGVPQSYGDIFLIFATLRLRTLEGALPRTRVQPPCPAAIMNCPGASDTTLATPTAYIMAGGPYPDLGIHARGAHCLVVYRDRGTLQGRMVNLEDYPNVDCFDDVDPTQIGGDTLLVKLSPTIGDREYYPTSARWSVDRQNSTYLAAIRCGIALECEVGRREGFVMSRRPDLDYGGGSTNDDLGTWRVRIRYDEQYLAVLDTDNVLKPTRILGRIIPDRGLLDHTDDTSVFDGTWVDMARVHLIVPDRPGRLERKALTGYRARFNFMPPTEERRFNEVSLCNNESGSCPGDLPTCTSGEHWFARIVGTDGSAKYTCVQREVHYETDESGALVIDNNTGRPRPYRTPHNARFRFVIGVDEGIWFWCPVGCCQP